MYSPRFNQLADRAILIEAMRAYSFAILFGPGPEGVPTATHLPLIVKDEGEHGVLEGHFAKANPHWKTLANHQTPHEAPRETSRETRHETLVVFSGPHSYVSPANYTEELSVPTWNYIAIHAYGVLELVEDNDAKDALLKDLIALHEPAYADRWRAMPEGFRRTMLAGITGFRVPIARIEGKFKLSQNRNATERANIRAAQASGTPDEQSLAAWMDRLRTP